MTSRRLPMDGLVVIGVVAAVAAFAQLVSVQAWGSLAAVALPVSFLVAGALGGRARPDHRGLQLLTAVGTLHLIGFALGAWAGSSTGTGWVTWGAAAVGDAAYLSGFVCLALVIALFPDGRAHTGSQRWFLRLSSTITALVILDELLLHDRLRLPLDLARSTVPNPAPVASTSVSLAPLVFGLVVLALPVLIRSARSFEDRRVFGWASMAAGVLGLMMLLSAPADVLVSDQVWSIVFVPVTSLVPFFLLAGLIRFRLLRVDVYVVRTLSRGLVVLVLAGGVAAASALLSGAGAFALCALLTVVAALFGAPAVQALESRVDRWATGSRVGRRAVADSVADGLLAADRDSVLLRTAVSLADGLDIAWVRVVAHEVVETTATSEEPEVVEVLTAAGEQVGRLECGPRRGGWSAADLALLRSLTGQVALAVRDVGLTRELADRVEELSASRTRLVQAEDTARRRVERDLHDGVQQQLVALLARLTIAQARVVGGTDVAAVEAALLAAHALAREALHDLRELVSGMSPPLLGDRGLAAAVCSRAAQLPIDVSVDADPRLERFPPQVEGAAYFVVLEALANVMKHSGSDRARVVLSSLDNGNGNDDAGGGGLRVAVVDAGNGQIRDGSGLAGLRDRVEALGGVFTVQATPGVGTTIAAELPCAAALALDA